MFIVYVNLYIFIFKKTGKWIVILTTPSLVNGAKWACHRQSAFQVMWVWLSSRKHPKETETLLMVKAKRGTAQLRNTL